MPAANSATDDTRKDRGVSAGSRRGLCFVALMCVAALLLTGCERTLAERRSAMLKRALRSAHVESWNVRDVELPPASFEATVPIEFECGRTAAKVAGELPPGSRWVTQFEDGVGVAPVCMASRNGSELAIEDLDNHMEWIRVTGRFDAGLLAQLSDDEFELLIDVVESRDAHPLLRRGVDVINTPSTVWVLMLGSDDKPGRLLAEGFSKTSGQSVGLNVWSAKFETSHARACELIANWEWKK